MKTFSTIAVALSVATLARTQDTSDEDTTATPTGLVVQVTWPGGIDPQTLVGSVIGVDAQVTTIAVGCPDGTDSNDCGFNPPVTITAGPTTLRYALMDLEDTPPFTEDCSFNSDGGVCTVTGPADITGGSDSDPSLTTETPSFAASDLSSVPITITAGETGALESGSNGGASPTPTGNGGTGGSAPGNGGGGSNVGGSSSSSTTSTSNDAKILVPGTIGAALMGLAALYL